MSEIETSGGSGKKSVKKDCGTVKVSEEVVARIAMKAISGFDGVKPAVPGFITGLRLGRKTISGVRVNVSYDEENPEIIVDAYVLVRYGLRLPDVCWDLQESLKQQLEKAVGYAIKAVNVYVCGIDFSRVDKQPGDRSTESSSAAVQE